MNNIMEHRVKIQDAQPKAWQAMYGLENYLSKISLTPIQKHLIKIRASQINACAFCINMHTQEALKDDEKSQRIFLLNAWKESGLFTEEEKAILAMTEEITLISQKGLTDETYLQASRFFNEEQIAEIIMTVITINAWNRIAVSTQLKP